MKQTFIYIFIVFFALGSVQAGTHFCMNMPDDSTSDSSNNLPDNQTPCHFQIDEPTDNNNSDNSCCDEGCESCVSVVGTFNSLINNYKLAYNEHYKRYGSFFVLSNHIDIPTPPPNS